MSDATPLVLAGARIYANPTDDPIVDGVILVEGESIAAAGRQPDVPVPTDARVVDCSGLTVTAGFANSHVHFFERKWTDVSTLPTTELNLQLEDFTRYGFTGVFDLSSAWENTLTLRDRIESSEAGGPGIRSTGEGLAPPGSLPPPTVLRVLGFMETSLNELESPSQTREATKKLLARGVDGIKLFISSPYSAALEATSIEAAVEEAHRDGKPVFAHPNNGADVLAALRAGVDVIAHTTPRSGPWDDAILTEVAQRNVAITPTLKLWQDMLRHDRLSAQRDIVAAAVDQLRAWRQSGGRVLFGTDYGAVGRNPTEEYALMARAGMSFSDILAALTTTPAQQFGDAGRRGHIAPGMQADLVFLRGDPADDIAAFTSVERTMRAGRLIYPYR